MYPIISVSEDSLPSFLKKTSMSKIGCKLRKYQQDRGGEFAATQVCLKEKMFVGSQATRKPYQTIHV